MLLNDKKVDCENPEDDARGLAREYSSISRSCVFTQRDEDVHRMSLYMIKQKVNSMSSEVIAAFNDELSKISMERSPIKTDINNLNELAAEVVMGWKLMNGSPFWQTPKGDKKKYDWNPVGNAKDHEEMLDTLRTYAVSQDDDGYYVTVYKDGEAYEGNHRYKRVAAIVAALKANGMNVEIDR